MKHVLLILVLFSQTLFSQQPTETDFVKENYLKEEVYIPMRDGTKLFTSIYIPKDASKNNKYPFLMQRTCYSVAPYGENNYRRSLGPNKYLMDDKYIFVYQDVRGRYMSEGTFTNMTPQISTTNKRTVDESTDTFDTIEWLLKNIQYNSGKVGQYGTSYPGFYAAVGTLSGHPALVASSPQAPISDFWNDDFLHNGRFMLGYFRTFPVFGVHKTKPESKAWYTDKMVPITSKDGLAFYREMGTLKEGFEKYYQDNFFMREIMDHPNYDQYWQERNLLPHLKGIKHAVLTVGGWFDAEDLAGPLNIYKTIERTSPKAKNSLVMGPFAHGGWGRESGKTFHNDIYFGDSIATYYQKQIETPFFTYHLKPGTLKELNIAEAVLFDTGKNQWEHFSTYPPSNVEKTRMYFHEGQLKSTASQGFSEYFSDPNNPVLSSANLQSFNGFTPRSYMTEDQRFAVGRPDVLTFTSDILENDLTITGELNAILNVESSASDADFIVKLIDVYPLDYEPKEKKESVIYGNYHQMVRSEIMPARFRENRANPIPMTPHTKTTVPVKLQDVLHTFKKGHRIQVQISSTWFPLFTVNPQKYVANVNKAEKSDYTKAFIKIHGDSYLEFNVSQ